MRPTWSLGEGNTPLVNAMHVAARNALQFKLESINPTGSYKDRFIAAEIEQMLNNDVRACVATSSGNTGSSLATYCARVGIRCVIVVNKNAPEGKLQQMSAHGAHVIRVSQFVTSTSVTEAVFATLQSLSKNEGIQLVVSAFAYCPIGMQGVEAIAQELVDARPDHVFVPVGGGGLYSAVVQGFQKSGGHLPRIHAVQPAGCLTLVGAYQSGSDAIPTPQSTTEISGLSVPSNLDVSRGLALLRACEGTGIAVNDIAVFAAQEELFLKEGIYCEPAGATAYAGWKQAIKDGTVTANDRSICLVTGHGFKDPASVARIASLYRPQLIEHDVLRDSIMRRLEDAIA